MATLIRERLTAPVAIRAPWLISRTLSRSGGQTSSWHEPQACALCAGGFLALIGPFGTSMAPATARGAFWMILLPLGWAIVMLVSQAIGSRASSKASAAVLDAATVFVASVPITIAAWLWSSISLATSLESARLAQLYPSVAIIAAGVIALERLRQRPRAPKGDLAAQCSIPARLAERLPPRMRHARLRAIEAEDHYVRIHTNLGTEIVLMRFRDGLQMLAGSDGLQVHRSWWVGNHAIQRVRRWNRGCLLVVDGGLEVPVSRRFAKLVRQEGWRQPTRWRKASMPSVNRAPGTAPSCRPIRIICARALQFIRPRLCPERCQRN